MAVNEGWDSKHMNSVMDSELESSSCSLLGRHIYRDLGSPFIFLCIASACYMKTFNESYFCGVPQCDDCCSF